MFNTNGGYSLSDIAAVSGNNGRNGGAFGDDWAWIIILLLCGWGNGGFGFGGGRGEGTTREEISYGFDMNGLESGIRGIQQGLCDGFYAVNTAMLTGFNGVQSALCQGFSGVNDAITQSTIADMQSDFALQTAINNATVGITAQLTNMAAENAACCCDIKTAIANTTRDIIDSNNAGVRSILDFLTQDKIATLTAENQSLKFAASQAAQNAFITANQEAQTAELIRRLSDPCPVPAYVVPNPNCCYNANVTFGNGCGCGSF